MMEQDRSLLVALGFREESENFAYQRIVENKGVGNARNIGLKLSLGTYMYFLDCDDAISRNFSDFLMSELNAKSDLVFTLVRKMPGGIYNSSYLTFLSQQPNFGWETLFASLEKSEAWSLEFWEFFIRREFLLDNQISFEPIRVSENMVFMTTIFSKSIKYSIAQDFVFAHYQTPGSLGKSFFNHDIETWFSAFLGLSNLALIGRLGKKDISTWVTGSQGVDLIHMLADAKADQTHAKFDILGNF